MTKTETETGRTKVCNVCNRDLPISEFYPTRKSPDGLLTRCKACHVAAVGKRQKEIPEQINLKNARWKRKNREQVNASEWVRLQKQSPEKRSIKYRRNDLLQLYGITPEWYEAKWKEQGEGCGICGAKTSGARNRRPHVDHDEFGARGILCHRCNTALERIENDPNWGGQARAYLAHYARAPRDTAVGDGSSDVLGGPQSLQSAQL